MKRALFLILAAGVIYFLWESSDRTGIPSPNPDHKLSYTGSIGIGKDKLDRSLFSFKANLTKLDYVSLYWYNLDDDGRISRDDSISAEMEEEVLSLSKENNLKIMMGIGDHGDVGRADEILDDKDTQKEHFSDVLETAAEKGYDGVTIDYENLKNNQEEEFTEYIRTLSKEIKNTGKILSISIPVETEGRVTHGINLTEIGKIADRLHLNIYEEYGQDTGPGPIASFEWVNAVIKNALKQGVPAEKIILGTAHSGHDWIIEPEEEFYKDMRTAETLTILAGTGVELRWDEAKRANFFEYTDEGQKHQVWLEDASSFKAKIDLAKAYELGGIFIWYLGGEDPGIWEIL
ncbi:MAG: chitinase [Candidatus Gottesmanbacteria bacterium GW2011_GWA2_43_14]|uniref:Chitinase n=1 Tax=Candidatus Gottesmanbacteria bacterium GW2011_GWA2_43_14 TaxID=1618443 RepID=A0A0G1DJZ5_9BACT|nr:MAG: chitinase [Candidatus Gottesmanbacteria bacterium GW2011_GWA2_43_14]